MRKSNLSQTPAPRIAISYIIVGFNDPEVRYVASTPQVQRVRLRLYQNIQSLKHSKIPLCHQPYTYSEAAAADICLLSRVPIGELAPMCAPLSASQLT
jgi:hypothetical protein